MMGKPDVLIRPTPGVLHTLSVWGKLRNTKAVAEMLCVSPRTIESQLSCARKTYGEDQTKTAYIKAVTLGHIEGVGNPRVVALEQIVRSMLCHDPQVPQLLANYYEKWGRSLLEVPDATL